MIVFLNFLGIGVLWSSYLVDVTKPKISIKTKVKIRIKNPRDVVKSTSSASPTGSCTCPCGELLFFWLRLDTLLLSTDNFLVDAVMPCSVENIIHDWNKNDNTHKNKVHRTTEAKPMASLSNSGEQNRKERQNRSTNKKDMVHRPKCSVVCGWRSSSESVSGNLVSDKLRF